MRKKLLLISSVLSLSVAAHWYAVGAPDGKDKSPKGLSRLENAVREMPDSIFGSVEMEDLLDDKVYVKLAGEGWYPQEIVPIMQTAIGDKKAAKKKIGYGQYAKQWLPAYGRMGVNDSMFVFIDTTYTTEMRKSVRSKVPAVQLNAYYEPEEYIVPKERTGEVRKPGFFRQMQFSVNCGRIHWMAMHPTDPDRFYVVPDGAGIFKTDDCGKHYVCITDHIPDRENRSNSPGYAIPVDPNNWDHVYAFMNNNSVYQTYDGGETWTRVEGATHKVFKRGNCYRDANGDLWFIGCTNQNWQSKLWVSRDECRTWIEMPIPDAVKDINPNTGQLGQWFQYHLQDPNNKNAILLPTSRSIVVLNLGTLKTCINTGRDYSLALSKYWTYKDAINKEMKVWGRDGVGVGARRYPTGVSVDKGANANNKQIFPCPATQPGELEINPNSPNEWWFATGGYVDGKTFWALYKSTDYGMNWVTLQDNAYGIADRDRDMFGGELPGPWLGGFGLNFRDQSRIYATSMSSAQSTDGGLTFSDFSWAWDLRFRDPNGNFTLCPTSYHNADNHFIMSHRTGRVFRGSDAGMLMIQTEDIPESKAYPTADAGMKTWHHIGGDMGQNLFYHIAVNEFGDQAIVGNTQDNNGQFYRYGRWCYQFGYEGSESFMNPYSGTGYVSGGSTLAGWDPEYMQLNSWWNAKTKADVVSGSWYITRTGMAGKSLMRIDDLGQKTVNLEPNVGSGIGWQNKFGLCRDKGVATIYVITNANELKKSTDNGDTFETVMNPSGGKVTLPGAVLATDPNNSDVIYLGYRGYVNRYNVVTGVTERLGGTTLPTLDCSRLFYHEGSGDLYFVHTGSAGIYLLECLDKKTGRYSDTWRYWTQGYNSGKFGVAEINYTTQEMVISDYGRSVWSADLEHPSDRFFDDGFALKEYSHKAGRRTVGIDTEWTIPLYYYFKWTVNGTDADCPYQYLQKELNPGDRVQLELTLREAPDVKTLSAVYTVPEPKNADENGPQGRGVMRAPSLDEDMPLISEPGRAIYSNGKGRLDLGYVDYFFGDFTIDMWVRPMGDGTILANKSRDGHPKGFELSIENGRLKFDYLPRNKVAQPQFEATLDQNPSLTGPIRTGEWSHIAVTHERFGQIRLYVNGQEVASAARKYPEHTLNNSMILSLFADGIERRPITGTVDELKIWSKALSANEVRKEMHSTNLENRDGMVVYYNFNRGSLEGDIETFTCRPIKNRVCAEVTYPVMNAPVCARYINVPGSFSEPTGSHLFTTPSTDAEGRPTVANILNVTYPQTTQDAAGSAPMKAAAKALEGDMGVYVFDAHQWQNEDDNLDTDFVDYHPMGYMIHSFDGAAANDKTLEYHFYPVEGSFEPYRDYRVYVADIRTEKQVWEAKGSAKYDAETGAVKLKGVAGSDLFDKKILIVATKPAIELDIEGVGADGIMNIYDDSRTRYPISAHTVSGFPIPEKLYHIESDGILQASGLYFTLDSVANAYKAVGELRLDLSQLGSFNTTVRTTLRSKDNPVRLDSLKADSIRPSMIPKIVEVRNRIAPTGIGTGLALNNASVNVGDYNMFRDLDGGQELTLMGWVRIDNADVLNYGGFNLITLVGTKGVTGLRINQKRLEYAQNGAVKWTLNQDNMRIEDDMLGRWMHLAVTKSASQTCIYINGSCVSTTNGFGALNEQGVGTLYIGKNSAVGSTNGNDKFCGAIDQVGVWKRALTQEEIVRNMHSAVALNDPGLLAYLNMDYANADEKRQELCRMAEINVYPTPSLGGSASFEEASPIPYEARTVTLAGDGADAAISLSYPGGQARTAWVSTFRGTPYCYLNHDFQSYTPLTQDFYGLTFADRQRTAPAEGTVKLTYRHRAIGEGDHLAVALRKTGTTEHLSGFIHAESVAEGVATFDVPASYIYAPSEVMFFTYPDETGGPSAQRPAQLQLMFGRSVASELTQQSADDLPTMMLGEGVSEFTILSDVMVQPRNYDAPVKLLVNETDYASISREDASTDELDFSKPENRYKVKVDLEKIDKYGMNTLTINAQGAEANELKMQFYLQPVVELKLLNGTLREVVGNKNEEGDSEMQNTLRSTEPVVNLEIEADFLQGCLPGGEQVKLEVVTDLDHSMSIGNGSLLSNQDVEISALEHHESPSGSTMHEGWNLIGNPYLSNINLTKSQNVTYDENKVTKFLYQLNPKTGNYEVHDMTSYEEDHQIRPFQSYFVQTMAEDATLTVTPVAKEQNLTKKTKAYAAEEKKEMELELIHDGVVYDRVILNFDDDAHETFVTNEDAAKFWNDGGTSPEFYAITGQENGEAHAASVNMTNGNKVSLDVKSPVSGRMRVNLKNISGLRRYIVRIKDNVTGSVWNPALNGMYFDFDAVATHAPARHAAPGRRRAESVTDNPRFTLSLERIVVGLDQVEEPAYKVETGADNCVISGLKGDATVRIFKPSGVNVATVHTSDDTLEVSLEEGMYIVVITEDGRKYTSKVAVGF